MMKMNTKRKLWREKKRSRLYITEHMSASLYFNRFTNNIMLRGNKNITTKIIYSILCLLKETLHKNPFHIVSSVIFSFTPLVKVVSITKGKRTYKVPIRTRGVRSQDAHARKLLRYILIDRCPVSFRQRFLTEFVTIATEPYNSKAVNKFDEILLTSLVNRVFSHFRW